MLDFKDLHNFTLYSPEHDKHLNLNVLINFNNVDLIDNYESNNHEIVVNNTFFSDFRNYEAFIPQDSIILENFLFLKQSTITSFFITNMVDIPICFKKSKSLYSKTFELPLLKFVNLIMRKGLREKTLRNITFTFFNFFQKFFNKSSLNYNKWYNIYNFLISTFYNVDDSFINNVLNKPIDLNSNHMLTENGYTFNNSLFFKKTLFNKLNDYTPLFSFYVRKVDKSIRKNTRGKSGKYMIIWKYIPLYKRLYVTMRWFLKDLKFQKFKTFDERLLKTIETFFFTPDLSFVYKLRKFTHFFVFKNHSKTLLKTLKSTS